MKLVFAVQNCKLPSLYEHLLKASYKRAPPPSSKKKTDQLFRFLKERYSRSEPKSKFSNKFQLKKIKLN